MVLSEYLHQPGAAIAALTEAIRLEPDAAVNYAGRGVVLARQGDFHAARADADKALELSDEPNVVYQVAGIYALTAKDMPTDRDRALFLLNRAVHHGYGLELIDSDPELAGVRSLPEVKNLVSEAKKMSIRRKNGG
jgi:Flp pilus assembly protein TadD